MPIFDEEVVEDRVEMERFGHLHVVLPQQDLRSGDAHRPGRFVGVVLAYPHRLVELVAQRLWHHDCARPPWFVIFRSNGDVRPRDLVASGPASPTATRIPLLRGYGNVSAA